MSNPSADMQSPLAPRADDPDQPSMRERGAEYVNNARARSGEYVNDATTSVGRALQTAANGLTDRALNTSGSLARAGQYLEHGQAEDFGRDLTNWVRQHPGTAIGIGFGVGLLLGRAFRS